jgi:glycosyltransferase 2 family protein
MLSWLFSGLQVWLLSISFGAPADVRTVLLMTAGYALAWAVGFLVIVAPAGVGAREVALATVLAPVLDAGEIVVVVLLSRVLFTAVDLVAAGSVALTVRGAHPEVERPVPGRDGTARHGTVDRDLPRAEVSPPHPDAGGG